MICKIMDLAVMLYEAGMKTLVEFLFMLVLTNVYYFKFIFYWIGVGLAIALIIVGLLQFARLMLALFLASVVKQNAKTVEVKQYCKTGKVRHYLVEHCFRDVDVELHCCPCKQNPYNG